MGLLKFHNNIIYLLTGIDKCFVCTLQHGTNLWVQPFGQFRMYIEKCRVKFRQIIQYSNLSYCTANAYNKHDIYNTF